MTTDHHLPIPDPGEEFDHVTPEFGQVWSESSNDPAIPARMEPRRVAQFSQLMPVQDSLISQFVGVPDFHSQVDGEDAR